VPVPDEDVCLPSNPNPNSKFKIAGGDVGWFRKGQMLDEFNVAFSAESLLKPIKLHSELGWHVLLVTDQRDDGDVPLVRMGGGGCEPTEAES